MVRSEQEPGTYSPFAIRPTIEAVRILSRVA